MNTRINRGATIPLSRSERPTNWGHLDGSVSVDRRAKLPNSLRLHGFPLTVHARVGWRDGEAVLLDYRIQADEGVNLLDWQRALPLTRITRAAAILGHVDPRDGWQDGHWEVDPSLDDLSNKLTPRAPSRRGRGQPPLPDEHHRAVLRLAAEAEAIGERRVREYIAQKLRGRDGHRPTNSTVSTWLTKARKWQREQQQKGETNE